MRTLFPRLLLLSCLLSAICFDFSCIKSNPEPPPVDSTNVVDLKKGLLVYLPFTGNFADSSGNNNPTTPLGGVSLAADPSGAANSAMYGSGNGQRVVVTNNGSIKFDSAFTFSANVLCRVTHDQSFVSMVKRSTAQGVTFGLGYGIPALSRVNFTVSSMNANCDQYASANTVTVDTSNLSMATDKWYNLIVTFNKGAMKMYANGQLISKQTSNSQAVPICPGAELVVGGWWDGDNSKSINGQMDEVRLYNRALNDKEIAKLGQDFPVQAGPPPPDLKRGLLLYLPFNGSIADSSGNNNPSQIVGSGAGLTYDENGYANSAYGSDGTTGRLQVTNNGSIQFDSAFSVSLSFMERVVTGSQVLASMTNVTTAKATTFHFGNSMQISSALWLGIFRNSDCNSFATDDATDTSTFVPQPEAWYNATITFSKGILKLYINGNLISQKVTSAFNAHVCTDEKVVIGGWWDNDPQPINGKIDNVRMYNRVLSSDEIALLAQYHQPTTNSIRRTISH